jgi:hypothetical protein
MQLDLILLSITIEENVKAGRRLVSKIRSTSSISIIVGGQAVKESVRKSLHAITTENISLSSTLKLMKFLTKKW